MICSFGDVTGLRLVLLSVTKRLAIPKLVHTL